jgi:hypothetical protein
MTGGGLKQREDLIVSTIAHGKHDLVVTRIDPA